MQTNNITGLQNSGTEPQLQQVLTHLHIQSLGDLTCQVCNDPISEDKEIILIKPASSSTYSIGQCQYHATQRTWSVLISPPIRVRSAQDTTIGRVSPDQSGAATLNHQPITESRK